MKISEQYLGADAACVLEFLRGRPNEFFFAADISRLVERETGLQEPHNWALPTLSRLLALNKVETDESRRYRVKTVKAATQYGFANKCISPQLQVLLKESRQKFGPA